MKRRAQERTLCAVGALLCALLACPCVFALDPSLDVSQYAHTAWRTREGFTKGIIKAIAQAPDGYLWLGTELGLLRFDGVRTVPWSPPAGAQLPSNDIWSLLVSRDGTLWIGTMKGLASWQGGNLNNYSELAGQTIFHPLEDQEGRIWAGGLAATNGRLCSIQVRSIHCDGKDGSLGIGPWGLYEDQKGTLWVGVTDGLWRWKPGPSNFYPLPDNPDDIHAFAEDSDGALLISTHAGVKRFVDGKLEPYSLTASLEHPQTERLLRDRDGGLWIGTNTQGLVHVHQGRTDLFAESDGLSSGYILALFEDREGSIWVATEAGLNRFRNFPVTTISANQGLVGTGPGSVLAAKDGSVWVRTHGGLNKWSKGRITIPRTNGSSPTSLFEDRRGRIWVSTEQGLGYLENDQFISTSDVPGGIVHSMAEDSAGNLWIANQVAGLLRLPVDGKVEQIPWAGLGRKDFASALGPDHVRGGLWLGFYRGGIAYFNDGGIRDSYSAGNGAFEGPISDFRLDPDGTLWVGTASGLSRLRDRHVAMLTRNNGLPCDAVHGVLEDDDHSFWLYMPCGLVRIAASELNAWAAAVDKGTDAKPTIHVTVFDTADGVSARVEFGGYSPWVAKSTDGKLWFTSRNGMMVVDPRHLAANSLPPPVHGEQISADHKTYDVTDSSGRVSLPPRLHDLQIDYTALSLVAPPPSHSLGQTGCASAYGETNVTQKSGPGAECLRAVRGRGSRLGSLQRVGEACPHAGTAHCQR